MYIYINKAVHTNLSVVNNDKSAINASLLQSVTDIYTFCGQKKMHFVYVLPIMTRKPCVTFAMALDCQLSSEVGCKMADEIHPVKAK